MQFFDLECASAVSDPPFDSDCQHAATGAPRRRGAGSPKSLSIRSARIRPRVRASRGLCLDRHSDVLCGWYRNLVGQEHFAIPGLPLTAFARSIRRSRRQERSPGAPGDWSREQRPAPRGQPRDTAYKQNVAPSRTYSRAWPGA